MLQPGEGVALVGQGEFANGLDGTWEYPVAERVLVRAVYITSTWNHGARIFSDWVHVSVEP
ncbi:hypothetical protein [Limnoglobus roseus]|uniref:hypothetical protein n=1 Tax=Limnoglobus roseus TaxID=2598579 RepID=UPI0011EB301F|nr:hypothetical protein [Limnoglobus roseus]